MEFRCSEGKGDLFLDLLGQRSVTADSQIVDIVVHVEHSPIIQRDGRPWYEWLVVVSVPDGGVQIGSDCPSHAPSSGYQPSIEFQGRLEGRNAPSGPDKWLFVRSRMGMHHARIHLNVAVAPHGGGPPIVYLHEYVLNPSGSRNLEFYSEMDVSEKYYVPRDR